MWNVNCYGNAGMCFSIMLKVIMMQLWRWYVWITIIIMNIKVIHTTCYTHRHSNMQIGRVIIYLDITHYSLTLIQTSYTLSLHHIQYHTHQPTQICYTHNILSQFSNICGIGSQANRQGNKTYIARTYLKKYI